MERKGESMYDIVDVFLHKEDVFSMEVEGQPVFEAKSTAKALGFSKPWKAIVENVDEGEFVSVIQDGKNLTLLNEVGLYSLAFVSPSPEAREFRKWMFSQSWFKTGASTVLDELLE